MMAYLGWVRVWEGGAAIKASIDERKREKMRERERKKREKGRANRRIKVARLTNISYLANSFQGMKTHAPLTIIISPCIFHDIILGGPPRGPAPARPLGRVHGGSHECETDFCTYCTYCDDSITCCYSFGCSNICRSCHGSSHYTAAAAIFIISSGSSARSNCFQFYDSTRWRGLRPCLHAKERRRKENECNSSAARVCC